MRTLNDYLLIRHTPGGREFPNLDCWGLVRDYYREILGIDLPEYTDFSGGTMSGGFSREMERGKFREIESPEDNAVIGLFCHGRLYHVGIYLNGRILHTSEKRGCRYERLPACNIANRRFYRYDPGEKMG